MEESYSSPVGSPKDYLSDPGGVADKKDFREALGPEEGGRGTNY